MILNVDFVTSPWGPCAESLPSVVPEDPLSSGIESKGYRIHLIAVPGPIIDRLQKKYAQGGDCGRGTLRTTENQRGSPSRAEGQDLEDLWLLERGQ